LSPLGFLFAIGLMTSTSWMMSFVTSHQSNRQQPSIMSNFSYRSLPCLKSLTSILADVSLMISSYHQTLCQTSHLTNQGQLCSGLSINAQENRHGNGGNGPPGISIAKQIAIVSDIHLVNGVPLHLILTGSGSRSFVPLLTDYISGQLQKVIDGIDIPLLLSTIHI